jgi:hypothetical protein
MKSSLVNDLNDIAQEIKQRIHAYADKHGISFEEAQKRAKLVIDGQPIRIEDGPGEADQNSESDDI